MLFKWVSFRFFRLFRFVFILFHFNSFNFIFQFVVHTNPEVTDWQVQRQKFVLAVPFIQVTVYKICSAWFLLLFFPLVDFSLNFLGMLVGCLDSCVLFFTSTINELASTGYIKGI